MKRVMDLIAMIGRVPWLLTRWDSGRPGARVSLACLLLLVPMLDGCRSRKSATIPQSSIAAASASTSNLPPEDRVMSTGPFERVSRAVTGTASILRRGNDYELRLNGVTVASEGNVRVYLVGHEYAATTRIVDETEMKYDMAALERGTAEQRIELPSEPAAELRSVVLFNPTFGVNLAVARLRPPKP